MKFLNDDEHIKTDFGYDRLNIRYKQCVKCRTYQAEYRAKHREEFREPQKEHYNNNRKKL